MEPACHQHQRNTSFDWLLWASLSGVAFLYALHALLGQSIVAWPSLALLAHSVFHMMNTMWWGILTGMLMVALLSKIPREFVMAVLGKGGGLSGIVRATLGGVLLDLCSHGILMVGAKLYERGASLGQVMAFLIASPWNSFSLTLILIALIGLPWTLAFIGLSMAIAVITGMIIELLVRQGLLPKNSNTPESVEPFDFWEQARARMRATRFDGAFWRSMMVLGVQESRIVLRWVFFGVLLAGLAQTFIDTSSFQTYFGATLSGLGFTVLAATLIEVCSEGSAPIAADIFTRAQAPGNSFAFLMSGVSTDYTELLVLRQTTASWKVALCLPLITLPQIIGIAWLINTY